MDNAINHPKHYTYGKYEHVDVVENWELGYNLGNVTKYLMRAAHKGNHLQDLQKARWYLARAIDKPWTAIVSYDLLTHPSISISIETVADDWFAANASLRKVIIGIGQAALLSATVGDVITNLQLARDWLDGEIIKLEMAEIEKST
jgi:hypothetical protein